VTQLSLEKLSMGKVRLYCTSDSNEFGKAFFVQSTTSSDPNEFRKGFLVKFNYNCDSNEFRNAFFGQSLTMLVSQMSLEKLSLGKVQLSVTQMSLEKLSYGKVQQCL
jgi:hypothetical protein